MSLKSDSPLMRAYVRLEENYQMTDEDYLLGGPRKMLTLRQFARANGYSLKAGKKIKNRS